MAFPFATVTNEEISQINGEAVPDNTKKETKFGLAVFTASRGEKGEREDWVFFIDLWPKPKIRAVYHRYLITSLALHCSYCSLLSSSLSALVIKHVSVTFFSESPLHTDIRIIKDAIVCPLGVHINWISLSVSSIRNSHNRCKRSFSSLQMFRTFAITPIQLWTS